MEGDHFAELHDQIACPMKRLRSSAANSLSRGRAGALIWWTFRDTASPPEKLAKCALKTGFPPIFLPVPFPIAPRLAFRRALQRATAKVPVNIEGPWRADRMKGLPKVVRPVQEWAKEIEGIDELEFGVLESWAGRDAPTGLPWLARIWIALDPSKRVLHMSAAPGAPRNGVREMMARAKRMFDKELRCNTAPEIGDGVVRALQHAGGVKLRAGLWSVPGEHGIKLAKSVRDYLSNVGHSDAGMLIMLKSTRSVQSGAGSLVEMGLLEEVEGLAGEIHATDLETIGTGALRTLWDRVDVMREKLRENEGLIGGAVNKLRAKLEPARRSLRKAASGKKVKLNRTAGPAAIGHLHDGISALRKSARNGNLEGLRQADLLLVAGQAAARSAGIAALLGRLRKLTKAAIHVNKKVLFEALERAATYVDKQARITYPVRSSKRS